MPNKSMVEDHMTQPISSLHMQPAMLIRVFVLRNILTFRKRTTKVQFGALAVRIYTLESLFAQRGIILLVLRVEILHNQRPIIET